MNGVNVTGSVRASEFVQSELFARTFREGMALVEETANYLDGEGREVSKSLGRDAALTYASASMRLTTQLMQIASWLLVLRAVREEEMKLSEAAEEKYRIGANNDERAEYAGAGLPDRLNDLMDGADQLYARISRLDRNLFSENTDAAAPVNDAAGQQKALLEAFGGRK